jgi:quinol monooxygenase YgiN
VIDFRLRKGATEDFHAHRTHVVYVITGFKIRFRFPDGRTAIRETRDGDTLFSPAVTHASENIGETDAHGILVELKDEPPSRAGNSPDDRLLHAVTLIRGIEGKEEELKQHLVSLAAPTRAEPGCVRYDLYRSPERANHFMRYEIWTGPEALEAHKATPHIRASFEKRKREGWTTEILTWRRVPD